MLSASPHQAAAVSRPGRQALQPRACVFRGARLTATTGRASAWRPSSASARAANTSSGRRACGARRATRLVVKAITMLPNTNDDRVPVTVSCCCCLHVQHSRCLWVCGSGAVGGWDGCGTQLYGSSAACGARGMCAVTARWCAAVASAHTRTQTRTRPRTARARATGHHRVPGVWQDHAAQPHPDGWPWQAHRGHRERDRRD